MTKRVKAIVGLAIIVILISVLVINVISALASSDIILKNADIYKIKNDDGNWVEKDKQIITIENTELKFNFDGQTTGFLIEDKKSGKSYASNPSAGTLPSNVDGEKKARALSQVSIGYYDSTSKFHTMSSKADSVDKGNYKIFQSGSKVRINYIFGAENDTVFVPKILREETFDKIISTLDATAKRRIKSAYTRYSPENEEENSDYSIMVKQYPVIKDEGMYIYTGPETNRAMEEISGYMENTGYDAEQYQKDLEELNLSNESESDKASFEITLEYSLEEDGLSAKILYDQIVSHSSSFTLQQVNLLENFLEPDQDGYFFVPDGSGAIIEWTKPSIAGKSYVQNLYGEDLALQDNSSTAISQSAILPVYGMKTGENGILAVIESGAADAAIIANVKGESNLFTNAYSSFSVLAMETTDIGGKRNMPQFNIYAKKGINENIEIKYLFLHGNKSDYSGMANAYREHLIKENILNKAENNGYPIYLEFLMSTEQTGNVLGVDYKKNIILSTFDEISGSIRDLNNQGIDTISVKLTGYQKGGLSNYFMSDVGFASGLGDKKALSALQNACDKLYLTIDFMRVYQDSLLDKFSIKNLTSQTISRKLVTDSNFDRVTLEKEKNNQYHYLVTPSAFESVSEGLVRSLNKQFKEQKVSLALDTAGSLLYSDFKIKNTYDRTASEKAMRKAVQQLSEYNGKVMCAYGNSYVYPGADTLLNMPLTASNFEIETKEVPFAQIVLHGYVTYTGPSLNQAVDARKVLLKTFETGAGILVTSITRDDKYLKKTEYSNELYSLNFKLNQDTIVKVASTLKKSLSDLSDQIIISHKEVKENVFETTFENGKTVVTDYQNNKVTVDGEAIDINSML